MRINILQFTGIMQNALLDKNQFNLRNFIIILTGSGTGLGLSLSYDIVKAHGGEIKAESKENEGSVFIIKLPIA